MILYSTNIKVKKQWNNFYMKKYMKNYMRKYIFKISPFAKDSSNNNIIFLENLKTFETKRNLEIYNTAMFCFSNNTYYHLPCPPSSIFDSNN